MYLFELITKWINPKKKYESKNSFDPFAQNSEDDENCEHIFLPIDSTGEILACTKCGTIIKSSEINTQ